MDAKVRRALVLAGLLVACVGAGAAGGASPRPPWRPHLRRAEVYARGRRGRIAFAVCTPAGCHGWRERSVFPSASLLKPLLLVADLNRAGVRHRGLSPRELALLGPMIRWSDSVAATRVLGIVGPGALRALAQRAGMRRFVLVTGIWGLSHIDALDQARFFLHIDRLVCRRHRAYAMRLLRSIVPAQRWGIGRVAPRGWRLFFKGGWGSGTGWVDHQTALLLRGRRRVALSILTQRDDSHPYGEETLRGLAARLLAGLR